jgi:hypothetical protein
MAGNDFIGTALLTIVSVCAILYGLTTFNYNLLNSLVPQYSVWIIRGGAGAGIYLLYSMYKG